MAGVATFSQVMDLVEKLSLDEKEALVDLVSKRTVEDRRKRLMA